MADEPIIDDSTDESDWESGPYCMHYFSPWDCDWICKCGHRCQDHDPTLPHECNVCQCRAFRE